MFIGHYAVGFASAPLAPRTPLPWLVAAPLFLDLLWPIFLLLGWEHVRIAPGNTAFTPLDFVDYPISHSLATSVGWALLASGAYWAATRYSPGTIWIAIGVVSHWVLDFVTHRADLPLWPGGPKVGLGLWNSRPATIVVEAAMFGASLGLYVLTTRPRDSVGRWSFLAFVVFTLAMYVSSIAGPPPPNERAIAWVGLASWIMPVWAAWFDRHRNVVAPIS